MAKNLVIVESPTKTKTLKKFLGRDYAVEASLGHIRDLVKGKKDIGIGPDFEPRYQILAAKKDVVAKLRQAAKKADVVYLAPDPDREGEAIAWHIAEILEKDPESIRRVTFNEITRRAVLHALDNPGEIDLKKVDAQQARRVLDRMMGFRLSPLLWEKVKQGLSAGRVQSVALKMVCDRQDEIEAFKAEEYWILGADLQADQPPVFNARLHRIDGKKAEVGNGEDAAKIVEALEKGAFKVGKIDRKESRQRPSPPFITSRLQQEAARRFGFSVKRTMALAQGLYEGREIGDRGAIGLITYMRTDSTRVADEAVAEVRDLIAATYGPDSVPEKPNTYPSKKGAQDAHEAIRPTTFDLPPDAVKDFLPADEARLYKLIWDRFVASQMKPAVFDVTQVDVENGAYVLRATGRIMRSPGFLAVYREVADEETPANGEDEGNSATLPPLREGQTLTMLRLQSDQKFTQPPALFSEATLVKALEENGIGRPSTYASILSTLSDREYAEKAEGRFRPSRLGRLVNGMLQQGFNDILNEGYTAALEEQLDEIEDGKIAWKHAVAEFDEKFSRDLETAGETFPNVKREGLPMDELCPTCGSPLRIRFGRFGAFVACSTYPDCSYTRNLEEPAAAAPATNGDGSEAPAEEQIPPCEECGKPMALKRSRFGTFYGCTGYPECKNIRKTGPKPEPPKPTGVPCFECGKGEMMEKRSRRGKTFWSCSRYPECKGSLWKKPVNKDCPECGAKFLLEKVTKKAGTQYVCNTEGCKHIEDAEDVAVVEA
ncbi:MAG TPA: type I DNA topoisomerase [Thermoanaerobaculia bacterium]|jgi:DNA topoisomerase-1|nr:type I DNA topoisomerase [Thermoanaerobaculia bacterium]